MMQGDTVLANTWQLNWPKVGRKTCQACLTNTRVLPETRAKNLPLFEVTRSPADCLPQQDKDTEANRRVRQGRCADSQMESHRKGF